MTADSLRRFVMAGATLDFDAGSHIIFLVKRAHIDVLFEAYIEPMSEYVESLLMGTIDRLEQFERIALYRTFTFLNMTRAIGGLLFESLGHLRLTEGVTLTLKPMEGKKKKTLFHWESHEANSMDLDDSDLTVYFPRSTSIPYPYESEPKPVKRGRLYIPRTTNQVAFDSFIILSTTLYIFQFTVASSHEIKIGLKSLSRQPNIPAKENWIFIFVIPPGSQIDANATLEVKQFLEGVRVYSAHLDVEGRQRTRCIVF
jgi:hypothetical protein